MGRSRQAAVPRARECKCKQSNKLVGLSFFSHLHTKTAGGNAKQLEVDIKLAKVIRGNLYLQGDSQKLLLAVHNGAVRWSVFCFKCSTSVLAWSIFNFLLSNYVLITVWQS